jgi:DNA-binding transcriptional regulator PaaX
MSFQYGCNTLPHVFIFATRHMDSTRTVLFGIFVVAGRKMTAAQVIALARTLGISATNVKSHLTRMVADGALRRSGPVRQAHYWPSPNQARVVEDIVARLQKTPSQRWNRTWLILIPRTSSSRGRREQLRASLWFDGFRPWAANTFVRPAWPERWALNRARQHLANTGGLCARGTLVGAIGVADVSAIYGLDSLDREARRLARWISHRRIPKGSGDDAFAARLRVGGLVARLVGHDPRLPPVLWDGRNGMEELVRAFRRFEARIAPLAQRFLDHVLGRRSSAGSGRIRSVPKGRSVLKTTEEARNG